MKSRFHSITKPTLNVLWALGIFPITKNKNNVYKFGWTSRSTVYAIIIFVGYNVAVFYTGLPRIKRMTTGFEAGLNNFFILGIMWPHLISSPLGLLSCKNLVIYLNEWLIVERDFLFTTGKHLRFPELKLISVLMPTLGFLELVSLLFEPHLLDEYSYMDSLALARPLLSFSSLIAFWYIQLKLIAVAFQRLCDSLVQALKRQVDSRTIRRHRLLYFHLSNLVPIFEKSMNSTMTICNLSVYSNLLIAAYSVTVGLTTSPSIALFGMLYPLCYCIIALQIVCEAGEAIITAGRLQFVERICQVTTRLSSTEYYEVLRFMDTIQMKSPRITAAGYIEINRRMSASMFSTTMTYMVILLQLRGSLVTKK